MKDVEAMTDKFERRNCSGCRREGYCIVLSSIIDYIKIGKCPCGTCLVKVVCEHPCEDYAPFNREVWEVYMTAFEEMIEEKERDNL